MTHAKMPAMTPPSSTIRKASFTPAQRAEQRHRVGAGAVIERLAERHEAGAPENDQAKNDKSIGEGDGCERHHPRREYHRDGSREDEAERPDDVRARGHQIFLGCARVNNPYGLNTSTSAITA